MNESLHLYSAPNDKVRSQARKTPVIEFASPNTPQMPVISCFLPEIMELISSPV